MKIRWISLAVLLSLMYTACAPQQGDDASSSSPSNNGLPESAPDPARGGPTAIPTPLQDRTSDSGQDNYPNVESSTLSTVTPSPIVQEMVRLSIEDLSRRLNVKPDQISVVEVMPVVWRDASLGCPKSGIDYIRIETPGYRISLETGGQVYNYHTDESRRVIRCNQ